MAGSIMLEEIFAFPGAGRLMLQAIGDQDANLIMANILTVAIAVATAMLIADIALALLDPRIRYGKG